MQENIKKALEDGLRKILSKIGISLLSSYHGAQIFEAVGLGSDLIKMAFDGTTSRIAGITLKELTNETLSTSSNGILFLFELIVSKSLRDVVGLLLMSFL